MEDHIEVLGKKILALLDICEGARNRASIQAVFPEFTDGELCQALVRLCETGNVVLGPAGVALAAKTAAGEAEVSRNGDLTSGAESLEVSVSEEFESLASVAPDSAGEESGLVAEEPEAPTLNQADPAADASEPASEWIPEITGETLLLGVAAPRDYSDTYLPEEEIVSLVANLGYKSAADDEQPATQQKPSAFKEDTEVARKMRKLLKRSRKVQYADGEPTDDLFFGVPEGSAWDEAVGRALEGNVSMRYERSSRRVLLTVAPLAAWVASLKDTHRSILKNRLAGKTLAECGEEAGLTRERVRQIVAKALEKRPPLEEDAYRPLFEAYRMDTDEFATITGEPTEVYEYLALTARTKKDERAPLEAALDDSSLDESLRERIRSVVDEGFAYVDGRRVPLRRQPVIEALLRRHATDRSISLGELLEHYRAFTWEHGMEDASAFEGPGPRALDACLDRWDFVLVSGKPKDDDGARRDIRFYDWEAQDFEPLRDYLERWALRDIECSTALILRDEEGARLAADLGLLDEYELHCAIRRGVGEIEGMKTLKRPMVCFGAGDRNRQVLDLIRELGPADAYELAEGYDARYGVRPSTFRGSFLKDFRVYERDGVYQCADAALTDGQCAFLESELAGRDYAALPQLKKRFSAAFPSAAAVLGSAALSQVGYRISGDLAVREQVDEAALFAGLIDGKRTFSVNDAGFGPEVFRNEAFRSELNKRIRAFEVVEYLKDSFLNTAALASLGEPVSQNDLRDYARAALDFMEPGRPYSVRSLREAGFSHKVSALGRRLPGGGDYFLGSLIATGSVGGRLKLTSMEGVYLFCRKDGSFSAPDLLVFMAQGEPVDEKVLQGRLAAEHGIETTLPVLRMVCRRGGVELRGTAGADASAGERAESVDTSAGELGK